jgi:hypothetical protein
MNSNSLLNAVLAVVSGVIMLALVSVLFSRRAATSDVLGAAGGALANVIGAAVSPITGNSVPVQTYGGPQGLELTNSNFGAGGNGGGGGFDEKDALNIALKVAPYLI